MAVYFAMLKPGDKMLTMDLSHGGHLTHGNKANFSGKFFEIVHYGVRKEDERIDYDQLARMAREHKPKMITVGASAYPRIIDFARMGEIAREVGALYAGGHRAHRRAGGHGLPSQPGSPCRFCHHHDAQDAARPARRPDFVQGTVRQGN